eukprot:5888595-Prymnesium_polylepis.1
MLSPPHPHRRQSRASERVTQGERSDGGRRHSGSAATARRKKLCFSQVSAVKNTSKRYRASYTPCPAALRWMSLLTLSTSLLTSESLLVPSVC